MLIDNDKDGVIVQSGPGDGQTYDADSLYSFTWTLDRCTSYTFTISDYYRDGLSSPGYAEVKMDSRKIAETLGRIDGNFGSDSSISIFICDKDLTSSPSTSLMPSIIPSTSASPSISLSQLPSMSPSISTEPSQSMQPSQSPSISLYPSLSASPTELKLPINGEEACEGHGLDEVQCLNIGISNDCCQWDDGDCWSAIDQDICVM